MTIDGVNLPEWKIRRVKYNVSDAGTIAEMQRLCGRYIKINEIIGNRQLHLTFEYRCEDVNCFWEEYGALNRQLSNSTIRLNGMAYDCCLTGVNEPTQVERTYYQLSYYFSILRRYKEEKTEQWNGNMKKMNNVGTMETPCTLSVLPASVLAKLTVTGLSEKPIIINHLEAGKEIVIDGEMGKVTCEGANKFGDYDAWEFPRLLPGENTVTLDSDICQVAITYKPLYL